MTFASLLLGFSLFFNPVSKPLLLSLQQRSDHIIEHKLIETLNLSNLILEVTVSEIYRRH